MKPLLILSTSLYFLLLESAGADDNKVAKIQQEMYDVIRVMALPDSAEKRGLVTERFIMLLPGEVLNYYDYCPIEKQKGVVFLPSRLPPDENTFLLTDKLPTAGESGNRLSTIYRDIVYTINTTGTGEEPFDKGYQDAMKYLREEVNDPEDPTSPKMPRFELYHRYKLKYYDTVSEVKGWIAGNQTAMKDRYGDYETWYHNHYQSLEAHSSASYSQWLINGQKSQVEEKISEVDIESVRSEIEDARRVLQEEELPSMDGGTVYYPVHLEPSNWYEYLIPR